MNQLDANELLQAARDRTGLADFGPADFMEGFRLLVDGINTEAHIRDSGWPQVRERFLRMLVNRLWFAQDVKQHPEILTEELDSPVIIVSLPRTGSTKLQRILGAAAGVQTPSYWMTLMFARMPGLADGGAARRIQQTRDFERWMYATSPGILIGHPMFTDEPEEDLWLLEPSFRHPIHGGIFHLPIYSQWLMRTDWMPAFDYLRTQHQYLRWQFPSERHRPWLAKTPSHFGFEALLCKSYRKPRFIVTHRDPVKCIPSITISSMAMRKLYSDFDSITMLGPDLLGAFAAAANQHLQWRAANPKAEVLDLSFHDITSDGVGVVRKVHEFLGIEFTRKTERAARDWERANPKDKHGKAVYSAASIGCSDEQIARAFDAYRKRFANFI
jgi:hypothetical protein